jgi:hypothetical protein
LRLSFRFRRIVLRFQIRHPLLHRHHVSLLFRGSLSRVGSNLRSFFELVGQALHRSRLCCSLLTLRFGGRSSLSLSGSEGIITRSCFSCSDVVNL